MNSLKGGHMKKSLLVLVAVIFTAFVMNSAFADSHDCPTVAGPIYTDTGTSGK